MNVTRFLLILGNIGLLVSNKDQVLKYNKI